MDDVTGDTTSGLNPLAYTRLYTTNTLLPSAPPGEHAMESVHFWALSVFSSGLRLASARINHVLGPR